MSRKPQKVAPGTKTVRASWGLQRRGFLLPTQVVGPTSFTSAFNDLVWTDTRAGVTLPDYKVRIKLKINATTPYDAYKRLYRGRAGHLEFKRTFNPDVAESLASYKLHGLFGANYPSGALNNTFSGDRAVNGAKTAFVKDASRTIQPFSGGVFIGELRQTLRMLKSPMSQLRNVTLNYLKGLKKVPWNKLEKTKRKQALVSAYLEYRYGVVPLLYDIDGIRGALKQLLTEKDRDVRSIQATGRDVTEYPTTPISQYISGITYRGERKLKVTVKCRISGAVYTEAMSASNIPGTFGIFPESFVPDVWELFPYSFLVDYVSNVQEVIAASSYVTNRLVFACQTVKTIRQIEDVYTGHNAQTIYGSVTDLKFIPSVAALEEQWFVRRQIVDIQPSLSFNLPGLVSIPSLNIAALLLQAGLKRPLY